MIEHIKQLSDGRPCFHFISAVKIKLEQEKEIRELLHYRVEIIRVSKNGVYVYYLTKIKSKNMKHECKKIKLTEEEADTTLRKAVEGQFKPWSKAKIIPCRVYECPKCGKGIYHLTSKPSISIY